MNMNPSSNHRFITRALIAAIALSTTSCAKELSVGYKLGPRTAAEWAVENPDDEMRGLLNNALKTPLAVEVTDTYLKSVTMGYSRSRPISRVLRYADVADMKLFD